jgi:purine-binding chemotaxis protein CheW
MTHAPDNDDKKRTNQAITTLFSTLRQYTEGHTVDEAELLRRRAREYARLPAETAPDASRTLKVLRFELGSETYALAVSWVQRVMPMPPVTRVPHTPAYFPGVVNVRGGVITVLDVRHLLGLGHTEAARELIVVSTGTHTFGLAVNRVTDVLDMPTDDITPLEDVTYARGVWLAAEAWVVVLDGSELFGDARLIGERNST